MPGTGSRSVSAWARSFGDPLIAVYKSGATRAFGTVGKSVMMFIARRLR